MRVKKAGCEGRAGTASLCVLWTGVLCAGLILYGLTVQRGISWQDSGMLQWRILVGDYVGNLGLALAHPLYIAIGRVFLLVPYGSEFTRLNFCSSAGMAVTLANVSVLASMLTGKRWIGLLAAGMLSVMHTTWWLSTIAEVYTWNAAFFSLELLFLVICIRNPSSGRLAGLFLCNGLNFSVHNLALLSLPVYGVWALVFVCKRRLPPVSLVLVSAAYAIGAAPLMALAMQEIFQGIELWTVMQSVLLGKYYASNVFNIQAYWNLAGVNAALSSLNFLHVGVPLGILGWLYMRKIVGKPLAWSLLALLLLQGFFFLRYSVPDQFTFILPTLVLFSLSMAVGMDVLTCRPGPWTKIVVGACLFSIGLMPLTYAALPPMLKALDLDIKRERSLAFRDETRYWIVPWKHTDCSAARFARTALMEAAPDGVIVCDITSYYPLVLMQERMHDAGAVLIETHTAMFRRYAATPETLALLVRERPVFIVVPVLNFIHGEHRQEFDFSREPGRTLYRLSVAGHGAI